MSTSEASDEQFAEGWRLIEEDRFEEGIMCFHEALAEKPLVRNLFIANVIFSCTGDGNRARSIVLPVRTKGAKSTFRGYTLLGRVYMDKGIDKRAYFLFRHALNFREEANYYVFMGSVAPDHASARAAYQRAVELEPDHDEAHYNLGARAGIMGDSKTAVKHLRRAIELDPEFGRAHAELGWNLLRRRKDPGGLLDEARRLIEKGIELELDYGWAYLYLGNCHEFRRDNRAAREAYEAGIRAWPDGSTAWWALGGFVAESEPKRARECFEKALELDPDDCNALHGMGKLLLGAGDKTGAYPYLVKAVSLGHEKAESMLDEAYD